MIPTLTGAQKTELRGRGQTLPASVNVGQAGASPAVLKELELALSLHELVKVRFSVVDRDKRKSLITELSDGTGSISPGAVGRTALFYRPKSSS